MVIDTAIAGYGNVSTNFCSCQANSTLKIMYAPIGIPQVLALFASLYLPVPTIKEKKRQRQHAFPSPSRDGKFLCFLVAILGAMVRNLANGEILPADGHGSLRGNRQTEIQTSGTYSFAYTGAVQIWCASMLFCFKQYITFLILHHSPSKRSWANLP